MPDSFTQFFSAAINYTTYVSFYMNAAYVALGFSLISSFFAIIVYRSYLTVLLYCSFILNLIFGWSSVGLARIPLVGVYLYGLFASLNHLTLIPFDLQLAFLGMALFSICLNCTYKLTTNWKTLDRALTIAEVKLNLQRVPLP
jgi:hypothetical protein